MMLVFGGIRMLPTSRRGRRGGQASSRASVAGRGVAPDAAILAYTWVRPVIEYASVIWGDASRSTLKEVESVQRKFLCRALGVRKCAPAIAVEAETGVAPLTLRRDTATLRYHARGCSTRVIIT